MKNLTRRQLIVGAGVAAAGAALWKVSGPGGRMIDGLNRANTVVTDAKLPSSADVVIIGAGIVGVTLAYHLASRGVSVVVCEKGQVAGEASGRAVGQVVSAGLSPEKMGILNYAKREWALMNERVGGDTGYRRNGYLSPFTSDEDAGMWEAWLAAVKAEEPEARILSASQVRDLIGPGEWKGGYFNPTDGGVEPTMAAPAIAEGAKRAGAKIVAPCAVRGIETSGGRVSGVVTELGTIQASSVVLAGGCWSPLFARSLGIDLPGLNIFSMVRSVYGVDGPPGTGDLPTVSWRKQVDGGYTISVVGGTVPLVPGMLRDGLRYVDAWRKAHWDIHLNASTHFFEQMGVPSSWRMDEVSPFEKMRVLQPTSNDSLVQQAVDDIQRMLPAFKGMRLADAWGGALIATPDNIPTASPVLSHPGLFFATGLTYGMTMGPAISAMMADIVMGNKPVIDPHPYRYERYIDGTTLQFTN